LKFDPAALKNFTQNGLGSQSNSVLRLSRLFQNSEVNSPVLRDRRSEVSEDSFD
jgi:hypothetical protein